MRAWMDLIHSQTVEELQHARQHLYNVYGVKNLALMSYLEQHWLVFEFSVVRLWINRYMHFGNTVTSRTEGAHARLKDTLQVSTGDLLTVITRVTQLLEGQV